ncbi:WD40-repeat-containing domain protein [Catenaria anguillulae PL171]|uniref:WD40-repeat-containing domain protein n=1 Tax=Catenaria anguillulae PL171 TaxID=765915 RepID=A0A1Y2HEP0_9FUNG|nr:WD40-repeat-containing domain protein [Catenaria anguillulae PL171]
MKVKTISRNATDHTRERAGDVFKLSRNLDPTLHPFAKGREYVRAVNSAKIERMMAKPFVGALSGHHDGVYAMAKHPTILDRLYSGAADGEVRIWSLSQRKSTHVIAGAHRGIVKGLAAVPESNMVLSVGMDRVVKLWSTDSANLASPVSTWQGKYAFNAVDHHRTEKKFATAGFAVDLFDHERDFPIQTFSWGTDSVGSIRFNPAETNVFASTSTDRAVILYDTRMANPLRKLVLSLTSNNLCWNPMEPFQFAVANEDHNTYIFDMRHMERATNILKDHVSAVLDVDYSPTGNEIVTGAYDKTLRVYDVRQGHSRDVYHTKRMQRLWCVRFSMDAKYVLSGSDDGNIRLWKSNASDTSAIRSAREKAAVQANEAVKEKYMHLPGVRKIAKHRLVPKAIKNASNLKKIMLDARKQKDENVRKNTKNPDQARPRIPERDKHVLGWQE